MIESFAESYQANFDRRTALRERVRSLYAEAGITLPDTLYRIHYLVPELVFDQDGYIIPQCQLAFPDLKRGDPRREVPMVHIDDLDFVTRFFAFPEFEKDGKGFLLLSIDTWSVDNLSVSPDEPLLKYGEFHGKIAGFAITGTGSFVWRKTEVPLSPKLRTLNIPILNRSDGYQAIRVG